MVLTVEELRKLWKTEFLPSIRKEINMELAKIKDSIKSLNDRLQQIEESHSFLSGKYDAVVESVRATKNQMKSVESKTEANEKRIKDNEDLVARQGNALYDIECNMDEISQYLRRDCLEITGIPVIPDDNPKLMAMELSSLLGVELNENSISTAHRLPDTKKIKNRIIVKFVHRDTREKVYKRRASLMRKTMKDLPSIAKEIGKSVQRANKIYINESLTSYRNRLFGRIHDFKKSNNFKFLWTVNGKISLRENETSTVYKFKTHEEFEEFLDRRA